MLWTDERIKDLMKYWSEGLSASAIAARLGGVSRNAVIGKVHRLNLPGRTKGAPATVRVKRCVAVGRKHLTVVETRESAVVAENTSETVKQEAVVPVQATTVQQATISSTPRTSRTAVPENNEPDVTVPISRKLCIEELSERTCKWPIGDPLQEGFNFCGNNTIKTGPYCTYHAKLAFQPSTGRRRSNKS